MAFVSLSTSFVLSLLLLLTTAYGDVTLSNSPPPTPTPHPPPPPPPPPHHRHHPPSPPPSHPPTPPPSHPPVKPPTKPPVKPPVKPPTQPPAKPPTQPPTKPPTTKPPTKPPTTKPPTKPPVKPPMRKKVAVEGVVYCKSCKYRGIDTLTGAAPLAGAVVKLQCNNSKKGLVELQKTDKNGYFFFKPEHLTTSGSHKCKVFIVSSPVAACTVPTNLHGGAVGATLPPRKPPVDTPPKAKPKVLNFELFTVGPFAFEAAKKLPCHY